MKIINWPKIPVEDKLNEKGQFYVYVYMDPLKSGLFKYENLMFMHEPFYVGTGGQFDTDINKRWEHHIKEAFNNKCISGNKHKFFKIKKIMNQGFLPKILILKRFKKQKKAINYEMETIKIIGRIDLKKGPLTNLTDGGDGAKNLFQETRIKISKGLLGRTPWNIYKTITKSQSNKIKLKLKSRLKTRKKVQDNRSITPYQNINKSFIYSLQRRQNISKATKGRTPWNKGLKSVQKAWNKGLRLSPGKKHKLEELNKMRNTIRNVSVGQYSYDGTLLNTYRSQRDAARNTGYCREVIRDCVAGKQLSAYGFLWESINRKDFQ